ncbi:MAG TPA: ROK family transcriptional regulator [Solirubrobacteraceae bacterium]|nr:ROK family transcriptional regulator [Solirubrobacteraceae bacterium]
MTKSQLTPRRGVAVPASGIAVDTVGTATDGTALRRGSRELLRDLNSSLLIELVRESRPISRADLARQSGLSAATVSNIVAQLIERGILVEVAIAAPTGGRPPVLLDIDASGGYVIGIKLRGDGITTVVCDLDAQVVASLETAVSLVANPAAAVAAIEAATRKALKRAGVSRDKVLGVGIGLSGVIDSSEGVCRFSHLLQWRDVELAKPLRDKLQLPVWVDHDMNTLTVAEKWSGDALAYRNFVTLSVGRGIGLGIVIDRAPYRGATGSAGELGHMIVEPGGALCECGRRGCLEALVGEDAVRRLLGERLGREISRAELIELAAADDETTAAVLEAAGRQLGLAVANMITLLNPELLIISGEGTELGGAYLDPVVAAVREQTFADQGRHVEVKIQSWGDEAWAVGAATLVLRESFSLPAPDHAGKAIWHR